ncbi:putative translation Initiation factor eIF-4e-like [Trypanosoma rangeli]|uniref:Putative translation Initiation factor eIF-4e-like n=1 Tax=Trypanosoma rangeli TaxID=5698 RepID=A0A422P286_TRYRA|nr:putative translation Initiation factor eIF-4e-like [Trypanosoma rangeli]RNF11828.1 putative translation Initiation factor eIF-4e-like [Trypanosoma rangeli]|eukprot:RNF11828.1 putative translation Initiation factor eIF-4e-like [Trypanosoma rangeli]
MTEATHALKDPWFLSYIPQLTPDVVKYDFKGDWNNAKQALQQPLDYVRTVEELWSTINSLPKLHQLGNGSTFIFARNNVDASYEAFPHGTRVLVDLYNASAAEKGVYVVLSSVLGEGLAQDVCNGKTVCDVLRLSSRPNQESPELVRLEVWLSDQSYAKDVTLYVRKGLIEAGLSSTEFIIGESSFEKDTKKHSVLGAKS